MLAIIVRSLLASVMRRADSIDRVFASNVRVFLPATYSTKRKALAFATKTNLYQAIRFSKQVSPQEGIIVACPCSHPFSGAEAVENGFKREILEEENAPYLFGRPIRNSIDEMRAMKEALDGNEIDYRAGVCVITCDLHSRSMRLLAREILGVPVFVFSNSYVNEVERDHPTRDQRSWGRWFLCSLARYLAVRFATLLPTRRMRLAVLDRLSCIEHSGER